MVIMTMREMPSIALLHEAQDILVEIGKGYKKENLEILKDLKERMLIAGFDAPYKALLQKTFTEAEEDEEDNLADIKKHVIQFRQIAYLKKGTLRRAYIAIGAHMLAESFLKMGYGDVVEELPIDGNYIDPLANSGVNGVRTYKKMMDEMEGRGKSIPIYVVTVLFKGQEFRIKIKNKTEMEEKVTRTFGPEADIVNIRTGSKEYPLIRSKAVRIALLSAIISYLSKTGKEDKKEKELKQLEKEAIGLLISPIFKFYLLNSKQERNSNNLYPTLTINPSETQLELFNDLERFEKELKTANKILMKKFELEKVATIQSKLLGAGVLLKNTKKDKKWVAEYLKIKEADVEQGAKYIEAYGKEGKGREFLERLKKKD